MGRGVETAAGRRDEPLTVRLAVPEGFRSSVTTAAPAPLLHTRSNLKHDFLTNTLL